MSAEAPKSSTSLVLMTLNSSVRLAKGITCSSINGRISLRFSGLVYKVCTSYNRDQGLHPASHLQIHHRHFDESGMSQELCVSCHGESAVSSVILISLCLLYISYILLHDWIFVFIM